MLQLAYGELQCRSVVQVLQKFHNQLSRSSLPAPARPPGERALLVSS